MSRLLSPDTRVEISTEVIIDGEQDAEGAGAEAQRVIASFTSGMNQAAQDATGTE